MGQILVRVKPGHNLYEAGGNRFPGQTFLLRRGSAGVASRDAVERVKSPPKFGTTAYATPLRGRVCLTQRREPPPRLGRWRSPLRKRLQKLPRSPLRKQPRSPLRKQPRRRLRRKRLRRKSDSSAFHRGLYPRAALRCSGVPWPPCVGGQKFLTNRAELVVVSDDPRGEAPWRSCGRCWGSFVGYFYRVRVVEVDSSRSVIPIFHNCPALWVNLGVKAAENNAVFKTDPECLPLTPTVMESAKTIPARPPTVCECEDVDRSGDWGV